MTKQERHLYEFGPFRMDPAERLFLRDGQPVPLTAKAFDTLLVLIQRHSHLVEKQELMNTVWAGSFVEESNLTVTVSMLRKALGDEGTNHKYIQTVAKCGYRFVADVRLVVEPEAESPAPTVAAAPSLSRLTAAGRHLPRTLKIAMAVLAALGVAVAGVRLQHTSGARIRIQSLAVLPFRSLGTDAAHDYVGIGMADAIITKLGSTGQIVVRPTSAVLKYVSSPADPLTAGREQKVDAILDGHIQTLPERVRVTVQLVRVADGATLWAETFEESPQHMFALEDAVAERIAQSMPVSLSREERKRLGRRQTENIKAYQLYLRGRYFWNKRTEEGLRRSIEYFEQATTEDPNYALAYAGLAESHALLASYGVQPARQAYPNAKSAALKAVQLDSSLAEAHASLGVISLFYEWNWREAEQHCRHAIALSPNYAMAHDWYAFDLAAMGRLEEALAEMRHAEELDPVSLIINTNVGRMLYLSRRYDEAIAAYRKVIDLEPNFARAHTRLGMTYAAKRAFGDAIREFEQAHRLSGPDPYLDGLMGYSEALAGNTGAARKLLENLTERSRHQYVPPFSLALICIGLGERDRAFEWLEKAYEDRSTYMIYAKTDPMLDSLRSDPRFGELLHRMGFFDKSAQASSETPIF